MVDFIYSKCSSVKNTKQGLDILKKFAGLKLPDLPLNEQYISLLTLYGRDLVRVASIFNNMKADPPVERNLPPVAGHISWVRHLYHYITEPMEMFQKHTQALNSPMGIPIIQAYNRLSKVLVEYEVVLYRGWLTQVSLNTVTFLNCI